jgi:hypothetical protein
MKRVGLDSSPRQFEEDFGARMGKHAVSQINDAILHLVENRVESPMCDRQAAEAGERRSCDIQLPF